MKYIPTLLALPILLPATGCSLFMAYKQPGEKDLNVLSKKTPRALVIAELGQPAFTETKDHVLNDFLIFVQGYSSTAKASRVAFHGAVDVLTFGLSEVIGNAG